MDRLATIYAVKKAILRLLPPKTVPVSRPGTNHRFFAPPRLPTQRKISLTPPPAPTFPLLHSHTRPQPLADLHLADFRDPWHRLGKFFFNDDEGVAALRDGSTVAAFAGPQMDVSISGAADPGLCIVMHRIMSPQAPEEKVKADWAGFPAGFSCPPQTSCFKARMNVWSHVSGLVRRGSALDALLRAAGRQDAAYLRLALAACLPVRVHDVHGAPLFSKRAVADPATCAPGHPALLALGLGMDGGVGVGERRNRELGSLLPGDKDVPIGEYLARPGPAS